MISFTNVEREKLETELLRDGFEKVGDTTYRKGSQWVEWVDNRHCASMHEQLVGREITIAVIIAAVIAFAVAAWLFI